MYDFRPSHIQDEYELTSRRIHMHHSIGDFSVASRTVYCPPQLATKRCDLLSCVCALFLLVQMKLLHVWLICELVY